MLPYSSALRIKQGEYNACAKIARDIQRHVQPRFIIPPVKEPDPEKGAPLTPDEIAYWTGERIGKHWPLLPAFLDPQYVEPALGNEGLRTLFRVAQGRNSRLVATATVEALFNPTYREFLSSSRMKLGVYVRYDEIDTHQLASGLAAMAVPLEIVRYSLISLRRN